MQTCSLRFTANLKSTLSNKSKILPNSYLGVYQLGCNYGEQYIGGTKQFALTGYIDHHDDSISGKWESSGATEHTKYFHGPFDWLHPRTSTFSN